MVILFENIAKYLEKGDAKKVEEFTKEALEKEYNPAEIIDNALTKGMNVVGEKFRDGVLFVPEVLMAARAMQKGFDILTPYLPKNDVKKKGKILMGTVQGDLHDIGKKLVSMMLEGAGFEVVDLGVDVSPEKFIENAKEIEPILIGMSAMLTTTMDTMRITVEKLKKNNMYEQIGVMIGGAPITKQYAQQIGAEYGNDAISAIEIAEKYCKAKLNI